MMYFLLILLTHLYAIHIGNDQKNSPIYSMQIISILSDFNAFFSFFIGPVSTDVCVNLHIMKWHTTVIAKQINCMSFEMAIVWLCFEFYVTECVCCDYGERFAEERMNEHIKNTSKKN